MGNGFPLVCLCPIHIECTFVWRHGLIASSDYILLHPISGHNQADDRLPEIVLLRAVVPAVRNLVKRHDAVYFIQPGFILHTLR